MEFTAEQIAAYTQGTVEGDKSATVNTFAKIEEGKKGALSFLANPKYEHYLYETASSIVLVSKSLNLEAPVKCTLIRVENPYESVARLLSLYESMKPRKTGISSLACIAKSAIIGENCYVGPFVVIGENAKVGSNCNIEAHSVIGDNVNIGEDTTLYAGVTVYHDCKIGDRCILHAGVVIGADGFGFAPTSEGYEKIPQIGIVTIEDDVEIGANTCVDRSTMGSTYVRKGVKLDNLVQIAHNVEIGENTVISSQTGVAGSTKVGEWCMLGGQVGVAGHIRIGDRTNVGAQSGISGGNLAARGTATLMGYPAIEHRSWARQQAALKQLPNLLKEVEELKREILRLKEQNGIL